MVPAPISKLTSTVAAAVELHRKPALVARLALWQRRPAGVVCVEQADVQLAPVAVYVEQQHAMQLAEFLGGLAASTEAAAAAATAGSSLSTRPPVRSHSTAAPAAARGEGSIAGALSSSRAASEVSFHASGPSGAAVGGMAASLVPPLQLNAAGLGAVATPVGARLPGLPPDLEALLSGQGSALLAPAEQKVYIDLLRIGTLELTLSFTPAPYQPDSGGVCSCAHALRHCVIALLPRCPAALSLPCCPSALSLPWNSGLYRLAHPAYHALLQTRCRGCSAS
jgi:hypothetical protein